MKFLIMLILFLAVVLVEFPFLSFCHEICSEISGIWSPNSRFTDFDLNHIRGNCRSLFLCNIPTHEAKKLVPNCTNLE
ncbi:hypothetical protein KC19_2G249400 [Ceratodon purpureus]|uniref:Uncharacterized protein n=1 Tax=Ceratodon purpureus TaxID=3225 RepID=A0A8T0J063_CERPU|nr:hypothetical protein KC19_2G249400 [Ceratodon purpureus]